MTFDEIERIGLDIYEPERLYIETYDCKHEPITITEINPGFHACYLIRCHHCDRSVTATIDEVTMGELHEWYELRDYTSARRRLPQVMILKDPEILYRG